MRFTFTFCLIGKDDFDVSTIRDLREKTFI